MNSPNLTVIAGCNGSGKSSFSKAFTTEENPSFDYDIVFLEKYNSLIESEIQDTMAHNMARQVLEDKVEHSIKNKVDFTYETNFNSTPLYWPERFRNAGFKLKLVFFCMDSIDEAKKRVQIRVENGGHFVPETEIENRFHLGYKYLNKYWDYFDEVHLFDTSTYKKAPVFLLSIIDGELIDFDHFPEYLSPLLPEINRLK